jgi:hypothetical protein
MYSVNKGQGENMATKKKIVNPLFEIDDDLDETETEWRGMPEFEQPDNGAFRQIIISFDDQAGIDAFQALIKQNITNKTKSIWFPPRERNNVVDLFWIDEDDKNNDE